MADALIRTLIGRLSFFSDHSPKKPRSTATTTSNFQPHVTRKSTKRRRVAPWIRSLEVEGSHRPLITLGDTPHLRKLGQYISNETISHVLLAVYLTRNFNAYVRVIVIILVYWCVVEATLCPRCCTCENWPLSLRFCAGFVGDLLLMVYRYFFHRERPTLQFQDTKQNRKFLKQCPSLLERFCQTPWCAHPYLAFAFLGYLELHADLSDYIMSRELLKKDDGGTVALDWFQDPSGEAIPADAPILFVGTTFAGAGLAVPVRALAQKFAKAGWRVVCFVKRGCGSRSFVPYTSCQSLCFAGLEDTRFAVDVVRERYPGIPMLGAGFSVGATQVSDYLSRYGSTDGNWIGFLRVDGVMDWLAECPSFIKRIPLVSKVLAELIANPFSQYLHDNREIAETSGFQLNKIKNNLTDFFHLVQHVLVPSNGFSSRETEDFYKYLQWCQPADISELPCPTLMTHCWQDMLQNPPEMPLNAAAVNEKIIHVIHRSGGHVIRWQGLLAQDDWITRACFEFGQACLANHLNEEEDE